MDTWNALGLVALAGMVICTLAWLTHVTRQVKNRPTPPNQILRYQSESLFDQPAPRACTIPIAVNLRIGSNPETQTKEFVGRLVEELYLAGSLSDEQLLRLVGSRYTIDKSGLTRR